MGPLEEPGQGEASLAAGKVVRQMSTEGISTKLLAGALNCLSPKPRATGGGAQETCPEDPGLREPHGSWDSGELQRPERTVDFGL